LNMILGYFYADFRIALNHFFMDNYDEYSSGFKHHAAVAKTGFHKHEDGKTELCGPYWYPDCEPCHPCEPCVPCDPCFPCAPRPGPFCKEAPCAPLDPWWKEAVYIISPVLPFPGFGIIFSIFGLMNTISGAGLPDYWSHNPNEAPYLARLAQDWRLMMSESDHYKHHVNPKIGYGYFSPLTNIFLEKICFWEFTKWIMREIYGKEPLNIPAMREHSTRLEPIIG